MLLEVLHDTFLGSLAIVRHRTLLVVARDKIQGGVTLDLHVGRRRVGGRIHVGQLDTRIVFEGSGGSLELGFEGFAVTAPADVSVKVKAGRWRCEEGLDEVVRWEAV